MYHGFFYWVSIACALAMLVAAELTIGFYNKTAIFCTSFAIFALYNAHKNNQMQILCVKSPCDEFCAKLNKRA